MAERFRGMTPGEQARKTAAAQRHRRESDRRRRELGQPRRRSSRSWPSPQSQYHIPDTDPPKDEQYERKDWDPNELDAMAEDEVEEVYSTDRNPCEFDSDEDDDYSSDEYDWLSPSAHRRFERQIGPDFKVTDDFVDKPGTSKDGDRTKLPPTDVGPSTSAAGSRSRLVQMTGHYLHVKPETPGATFQYLGGRYTRGRLPTKLADGTYKELWAKRSEFRAQDYLTEMGEDLHSADEVWGDEDEAVNYQLTENFLKLEMNVISKAAKVRRALLPKGTDPGPICPHRDPDRIFNKTHQYFDASGVTKDGYREPEETPTLFSSAVRRPVYDSRFIVTVSQNQTVPVAQAASGLLPRMKMPGSDIDSPMARAALLSVNTSDMRRMLIGPVPVPDPQRQNEHERAEDKMTRELLMYKHNPLATDLEIAWTDLARARHMYNTKSCTPPLNEFANQYFFDHLSKPCTFALLSALKVSSHHANDRHFLSGMDTEFFSCMIEPIHLFKNAKWLLQQQAKPKDDYHSLRDNFSKQFDHGPYQYLKLYRNSTVGQIIIKCQDDLRRLNHLGGEAKFGQSETKGPYLALIQVKFLAFPPITMSLFNCNGEINPVLRKILVSRRIIKCFHAADQDLKAIYNTFQLKLDYRNGIYDVAKLYSWRAFKPNQGVPSALDMSTLSFNMGWCGNQRTSDAFKLYHQKDDFFVVRPDDAPPNAMQRAYGWLDAVTPMAAGSIHAWVRPERVYLACEEGRGHARFAAECEMTTSIREIMGETDLNSAEKGRIRHERE